MSKLEHKEFENYLQGDSELSQIYTGLKSLEPSADLDFDILKQSKSAVKSRYGFSKLLLTSNLDSPLAMAAVVFLCVSLVLVYSINEPNLQDENIPSEPLFETVAKPQLNTESSVSEFEQDIYIEEVVPAASRSVKRSDTNKLDSLSMKKEKLEMSRLGGVSQPESPVESPAYMELEDEILADGEAVEMKDELQKQTSRRLPENVSRLESKSSEALVKNIKLLINNNKIDIARSEYQNFLKVFPEQDLSKWLTDQEIALLDQ